MLLFAQLEGRCYCCVKAGHKSPQCYQKDKIQKDEWAINKTQLAQTKINTNNASNTSTGNPSATASEQQNKQHVNWAGVHIALAQNGKEEHHGDQKKLILLDSDSNATVFYKRSYVTKVWDVNESMGLGTNGGGHLE